MSKNLKQRAMSSIINLLVFVTVLYTLILLGMYLLQRNLMYLPSTDIGAPLKYGLTLTQEIELPTADNNATTGWYLPGQAGFPTIIYFHGNAGNLAVRAAKYKAFNDAGYAVIAPSYRGYGNSAGSPTEDGLYEDARAAMLYAKAKLGIAPERIILYGESLGSGVAVQMATEHKVGGIVLEAPYTSVTDRSQEIYPYLPVRLLIKDRYESLQKITSVTSPLLIVHGKLDTVIPYSHGKALLEAANQPKRGVFYDHVGHSDFDSEELVHQLASFCADHKLIK